MVYMEPVVALLRGAGCVVKDVLEGRKHWLMDPVVGKVTAIETVIAPTQGLAVIYNFSAAVPHFVSRIYSTYADSSPTETQWAQGIALASAGGASPIACELVKASLTEHFASARQKDRVMAAKMVLGEIFVLMTLLTLHHVYMTALQWSLLFTEMALLYLLTVMCKGAAKAWQRAGDLRRLAAALDAGAASVSPAALPLLAGPVCNESVPAAPWAAAVPATDPFGVAAVRGHIKEVHTLEMTCASKLKAGAAKTGAAAELRAAAGAAYASAALDFVLFLLNAIAWLGFLTYPITYFVPEAYLDEKLPGLWPGHGPINYAGNLLGDVCWTIEPALALTVPLMIEKAAAVRRAADKKQA